MVGGEVDRQGLRAAELLHRARQALALRSEAIIRGDDQQGHVPQLRRRCRVGPVVRVGQKLVREAIWRRPDQSVGELDFS